MSVQPDQRTDPAVEEAARRLSEAAAAKKCWSCGCLHGSLASIKEAIPEGSRPSELKRAVESASANLAEVRYDCLGCEVCFPALAINALSAGGRMAGVDSCPTETVKIREGWPPLPGAYTVLRYRAPVAICTLTSEGLMRDICREAPPEVSVVGMLQTENLGIERVLANVLANPHIRFLVVCGADSRRAIGHLPGQSLVALAANGVDEHARIVGANGKRPVLRNVSREAVEHFRKTVAALDLIGQEDVPSVLRTVRDLSPRSAEPAEPFESVRAVTPVAGYLPATMISDPSGYFVVDVDRARRCLRLEHYRNEGMLDAVIEGTVAAELYVPAIERGLLSRLDHAAYLGRELARAERTLAAGGAYVQDGAPEKTGPSVHQSACGCAGPCEGEVP